MGTPQTKQGEKAEGQRDGSGEREKGNKRGGNRGGMELSERAEKEMNNGVNERMK